MKFFNKFEPTIKGNPGRLTLKQHIHSSYCISMFTNFDGVIEVRFKSDQRLFTAKPDNQIFCAIRIWDQRAESGFMKSIEDDFHKEVKSIIDGNPVRNHDIVSKYFLLWRIRNHFKFLKGEDLVIKGTEGDELTKHAEEIVESKRGAFIRKGGVVPDRFNVSFQIQSILDIDIDNYKGHRWGRLESIQGEFIVSDCYKEHRLFPISPKIVLATGCNDGYISERDVKLINSVSLNEAKYFYYSRNFQECPLNSDKCTP